MDYGMKDGSIRMRVRAAVAGYMLLRWSVDCSPDHSLREEQYRLWLSDPLALYGVENAKLAPGYRLPAVAARCVCAPAPRDAQRDVQVPSNPGEFHPEVLTDSVRETLAS